MEIFKELQGKIMGSLKNLKKICSCSEISREPSVIHHFYENAINKPSKFILLPQKVLNEQDSLEVSEVSNSSELDINENFPSSEKVCFLCMIDEDLIKLSCDHYVCDTCICNLLETETFKKKVEILRCPCKTIITSNLFQEKVLEETLILYLDALKTFKEKDEKGQVCVVCGFSHQLSCSEFYRESKKLMKCSVCKGNDEEYLLQCKHSYCSSCLRALVRNIFESDPFANIMCGLCLHQKIIIPLWMLQNCFGRPSNYLRTKQAYIENGILSPKLECLICNNVENMNKVITLSCNHQFCKACVSGYVENKINEMKVRNNELTCPLCETEIEPLVIQDCVSSHQYANYLELTIKKYKPSSPLSKIEWCLECGVAFTHKLKENAFCPNCSGAIQVEKNESDIKRGKKRIKEENNPVEVTPELPDNVLICPSCKNGSVKDSGCNFIQCKWPDCEIFYCSLCKRRLKVIII
jgi:hypothetical protein